jgi:hypothetical protein
MGREPTALGACYVICIFGLMFLVALRLNTCGHGLQKMMDEHRNNKRESGSRLRVGVAQSRMAKHGALVSRPCRSVSIPTAVECRDFSLLVSRPGELVTRSWAGWLSNHDRQANRSRATTEEDLSLDLEPELLIVGIISQSTRLKISRTVLGINLIQFSLLVQGLQEIPGR